MNTQVLPQHVLSILRRVRIFERGLGEAKLPPFNVKRSRAQENLPSVEAKEELRRISCMNTAKKEIER